MSWEGFEGWAPWWDVVLVTVLVLAVAYAATRGKAVPGWTSWRCFYCGTERDELDQTPEGRWGCPGGTCPEEADR